MGVGAAVGVAVAIAMFAHLGVNGAPWLVNVALANSGSWRRVDSWRTAQRQTYYYFASHVQISRGMGNSYCCDSD